MRVGLLSTFPPRQCGIATFAGDLFQALRSSADVDGVDVVAVVTGDKPPSAPVAVTIEQETRADYVQAGRMMGRLGVDVVMVEHEFGIYGGRDGEYVLSFTSELPVPYVVTLHTVLANPTVSQAYVLRELCRQASGVVVFTARARAQLVEAGLVEADRVHVIPHGAPAEVCAVAGATPAGVVRLSGRTWEGPVDSSDRFVMSSFGLLSPGKGLEVVIDALAKLAPDHPEAHLVIAGRTHPEVARREGERYRHALRAQVDELGLDRQVTFDDRFLPVSEIGELLAATDVFVTAYTSAEQAVSGALTFAVAAGCAFVSTPYPYATELHRQGAGRLVPYGDSAALAETLAELLDDPDELARLRAASRRIGAAWSWPDVGRATAAVLADACARNRLPVVGEVVEPRLPPLRLDHLRVLVDDVGIVQHARGVIPWRESGYCVDDVARLIPIARRLAARDDSLHWSVVLRRSLAFLEHATAPTGMHNFMGYDRRWLDEPSVGDHVGRAIWALGDLLAGGPAPGVDEPSRDLLDRLLHTVDPDRVWPRTAAFTLLGLSARAPAPCHVDLADALAARLAGLHAEHAEPGWDWFEATLTYDNARLPQALIAAGRARGCPDHVALGVRTLRWYGDQCGLPGRLELPGNEWRPKGAARSGRGDEQPLDAAALVDAEIAAYTAIGAPEHARRALAAFAWFTGSNRAREAVYDSATGGCHDGLTPDLRLNGNQGAESTLAYYAARLAIEAAGLSVPPHPDDATRVARS